VSEITGRTVYELGHASFRDVEFTGIYYTTTDHLRSALGFAREGFARYLAGCGHDIGPGSVQVTYGPPEEPLTAAERKWVWNVEMPGLWGPKARVITASARVMAPVRSYPRCGNWMCTDDGDWAEADPVDEPAVYAGVAAEGRYVDRVLSGDAYSHMPLELRADMLTDMLASRRGQAGGRPLWTADIRPRAPVRM
jgi:hypothetical protein